MMSIPFTRKPNQLTRTLDEVSRMMSSMNKTEREFKLDFVPVIFANGEDDDKLGLNAAFKNDRVQYEDKIYKPNETILIVNKIIALTEDLIFHNYETGKRFSISALNSGYAICYNGARVVQFHSCRSVIIAGPRM